MKLTSFALAFLASTASAANFYQQASSILEIAPAGSGKKVPGENPLFYCGDTKNDILEIETVDLVPNPPTPGATLVISAVGVLNDVITKGALVDVTVKYGLITLIKQTLDLCDNVGKVDLECPVNQGKMILNKSVDLPSQIPPGTYTVIANAYAGDQRPITCLTATIKFY